MALWTPADITTTAWYDADDAATITESSGSVSQWDDKSGNGYDLVQATSSNQFITGTVTIGGLNALDMDGSNDFMSNAALGSALSGEDIPNSIFYVFKFDVLPASNKVIGGLEGAFARNWCMVASSKKLLLNRRKTSEVSATSTTLVTTTAGIYGYLFDGVDGSLDIDGVIEGTTDMTAVESSTYTSFRVGSSLYCPDGRVGEVIVLDSEPTQSDRELIEGYLAHKWGTEGSLPGGHPYKSEAPTTGISIPIAMHHYTKNLC